MKKYVFIALAALFSQTITAQGSRFIYEATMKPDVSGAPVTERVYLDVDSGKSVFYGENRVKRDSLMQRMRDTRNFQPGQMENFRSAVDYIIEKDLRTAQITYRGQIGRDQYQYTEDRTIDWQMFPETLKIGEYNAQKAETEFGGRKWTAWFSADVPFPDGPYKFSGLPGLILKIEDESGDYSFDLREVKQIPEVKTFHTRSNLIKLKRKDYEKQMDAYRKDPAAFMRSRRSGPMGGPGGGGRGGFQPDAQRMKEMENRMKEMVARDNNPIEKQ